MVINKIIKKKSVLNYTKLLQYIIKKGKKNTLENIFRKGLIFWIKKIENKNFNLIIQNAFSNIIPLINIRTKRKGSKNIYIPFKISKNKGNFLAAKWLLTHAISKKKYNIYESIIEELLESSLKKSSSIKKRNDLYKLAEENLINIKNYKFK